MYFCVGASICLGEGDDQGYSKDFGSTFKSPQFPVSGEVGWLCAENLLNAAIRESEKLNVKVDPIMPPNPHDNVQPPR